MSAAPEIDPTEPWESYLTDEKSIGSWLFTTDHKRIGLLFLGSTTFMLLVGGVLALIMRMELVQPGETLVSNEYYNRLFTMHGVIMVWLFMIPAIPSGFGNFVLPMMIGAKEIAFPRLNIASWYVYMVGAVTVLVSLFYTGTDTGWTFYVPYSANTHWQVLPVLIGVFILGWSTIITGLNFIVTTHTMRAKGVTWHRMPLMVWALYATSIVQVIATPVLGMTLLLVFMDNAFDWGVFDPSRGGDPILYQHIFWFYSHPAVYIMVLPAMGVVSEVVCTFAHRNPQSYVLIAYSSLGIAFVGFLSWGHHMFVAGMSTLTVGAFGITSMLVAIFSAIKVFSWTGTFYRARIAPRTPLLYILTFLYLFSFGGMTGVAVATTSIDVHWHDTYFVVAHFHFIMVGGVMTAFFAAAHYWFPLITGRTYPEILGASAAGLMFVGFNLTFTPQFMLGNMGMVRRAADYPPDMQWLHVVSTAGSWFLGAAVVLPVTYLAISAVRGPKAAHNPWYSRSYEWRTRMPPTKHNYKAQPHFGTGPYDYHREL